jgi:hypothetical protein
MVELCELSPAAPVEVVLGAVQIITLRQSTLFLRKL